MRELMLKEVQKINGGTVIYVRSSGYHAYQQQAEAMAAAAAAAAAANNNHDYA